MEQSCGVTSDNRSLLFAVQLLGGKFAKFSSAWTWQRGAAVPVEDYLPSGGLSAFPCLSQRNYKDVVHIGTWGNGDGVCHFKFD